MQVIKQGAHSVGIQIKPTFMTTRRQEVFPAEK